MTATTTLAAPLAIIVRIGKAKGVQVGSWSEASRVFNAANLSGRGSAFYARNRWAGEVLDARTGEQVARISPNGRVWAGKGYDGREMLSEAVWA